MLSSVTIVVSTVSSGSFNDDRDCLQTGALVALFVKHWGEGLGWVGKYDGGPHEANILKLDCSKIKAAFGWKPRWNLETAIEKTVEWSKAWAAGRDVRPVMDRQIEEFIGGETDG